MEQHEYIADYVDNLPVELRPDVNEKLKQALRKAWTNRWDAKSLAFIVSRADYSTAHSPAGAALHKLEQLSNTQPSMSTGFETQSYVDSHCRKSGCMCTHSHCYKGWQDGIINTVKAGNATREYESTQPCPVCRQEQYEILLTSRDITEASLRLMQRSSFNQKRKVDY
jgi:hypothetical protein